AFLVTTDIPEIYMQEFWANATVHHHSIRFKMDNKKHIVNLKYFREMMHICPRLLGQTFNELPFEEEILAFLRFLRHSREIRKLTDNIQQFSVMLPVELTNEEIRNSEACKEYYSVASGAAPPKTKASVRKKKSTFDTTITPPTAVGTRLSTFAKGKQPAKASKAKSLIVLSEIAMTEAEEINDEDDDDDDDDDVDERSDEFVHPKLSIHEEKETKDEESFDPIAKTPKNLDDEGNDDASLGLNVGSEEGQDAEDDEDELYRDVNINLGRDVQMTDFVTSMLNPSPDTGIESLFETTPRVDVQGSTTVASLIVSAPTLPPPTIPTTYFSEFVQTNQFAGAISSIPRIVQRYMDQRMNEAVKIEKTINVQLEAEILTRSSNTSKTSYAVADDLSEMELKKILIEKMESNKSIHRSDEQRNLYKALFEAYESDKIILDTYGDTVTLKRRCDDADKDKEPSTGSDRGSKRRREGKEPESTNTPKEKQTKTTGKSTQGSMMIVKLVS
nr:hypothetical protein [Tanacetum cinerariifolium]